MTYGGLGTTKTGVHAEDHTIIYTGNVAVKMKKEKIEKQAIRMYPFLARHKLHQASRINYAKVYTVEYNVKVQFVGIIAPKHQQRMVIDYNLTHRPLPDHPFIGETTESASEHAQGADPRYSEQAPASIGGLKSFSPGTAGNSALPNSSHFQPTGQSSQTSNYPAAAVSPLRQVQYSSVPAITQPDSSHQAPGSSNDGPLYEDDLYGTC